ncbi:MAG: RNA-guided pseudouridylation complex pseudouridine synthase subunit Cbf5 [Nanoarchaeota archaeon]|nr:RNA-guided pseudouridylation complex pseudouridine synthase subunit Cbf5 [Nanoarchaeota archaeon]
MNIEKIKSEKSMRELLEFGIINVDKPSGPTSFNVSDFVRKELSNLGVRKTSHFGTLDPKVTGVLPVALNRACKLTGFFLGEDKEYIGVMTIHEETDADRIRKAIEERFTGKISQLPPKKSRVKRVEREREIKRFDILEVNEKSVLFHAEVQGGTYIRKLVSDLGDYLGCGAHMLELRRVRAGIFKENDPKFPSISLYELQKAAEEYKNGNESKLRGIIIPGEIVSELYPVVEIKKDNLRNISTGKPILKRDLVNKKDSELFDRDDIVCIFCLGKFIEMARIVRENETFSRPEFVFGIEKF